jgi:alpha-tubulin suppressor-like RCC1 family protein
MPIPAKIVEATAGFEHAFFVSGNATLNPQILKAKDKGKVYGTGTKYHGLFNQTIEINDKICLLNAFANKFICKLASGHYHCLYVTLNNAVLTFKGH